MHRTVLIQQMIKKLNVAANCRGRGIALDISRGLHYLHSHNVSPPSFYAHMHDRSSAPRTSHTKQRITPVFMIMTAAQRRHTIVFLRQRYTVYCASIYDCALIYDNIDLLCLDI